MANRPTTIISRREAIHLGADAIGDGEPLVLLPGLGRAASDVRPLADILVNHGYAVLLPEPRGIGASTGPLDAITLHDLAADIASLIEQWISGPATIIGHAFGNRIARTLAADRADLVSAVVLLSSSGKVQPTDEIAEAIRLAQAVDTPPDVRRIAVQQAWFAPGHDGTAWLDGWSQPVMKAYLAAAAATPVEEWWTAGSKPVLIVQGLCDVAAPVGNGRLLKQELGERGTLIELPDIGHAMPVEDPHACARPILEFLRRQR
ncbi:MAG TPA: alpha/beta fold hydrolase [Acetobacteraceae bacterium]|jgi:pimeloyl-ACP methyl ester carboxylesterase|nr:alpha/beta fold hydrolase [Acetobacteraceae bacterium]